MSSIQTAIELSDRMSAPLYNICTAVNMVISNFEALEYASSTAIDTSSMEEARQLLADSMVGLQDVVSGTNKAEQAQEEYNQAVYAGTTQVNNWLGKITQVVGAYVSFQAVSGTMKQAIDYASDLAEVQNVVDVTFGNATQQINEWSQAALKVYGINEVTAKQYTGTMGAMLKSSGLAGNAVVDMSMNLTALAADMASFYNLDTDVAFEKIRSGISGETEPLKQLGINMSVVNLEAYAMTQGITESYSEMSQAEQTALRYSYLLQATADAQGDFARTSSSYANQIRLLGENWTEFTGMVASQVIPVLTLLVEELNSGISWLSANWSVLQPVLLGIIALVTTYTSVLAAHAVMQGISNAIELVAEIQAYKTATALLANVNAQLLATSTEYALAVATAQATVAQAGFNTALLACPLTWIVAAIIIVIAAIYLIVAAINKTQHTAYSATGVVAGIFATLGAHIINTFVVPAWNGFATLANFFGNVFNNPVAAVEVMFYDLCLTVLGYISNLASAIQTLLNKIPGVEVDITSGLDGFYSKLEEAQQAVKDKSGWVEQVSKMDYVDYQTAYNKGYDFGQGVENKVSDFFGGIKDLGNSGDTGALGSYGAASDMAANVANIAGDTSSISDSLDVSEEDLKYLRDIAEQEAINRFTTAEIKVDMSGMSNTVHNTNDLDGIVDGLTTRVLEAMEAVKEGA
ncbi:MAG: hypothetical protein ACLR0V_00570 [Roseburia hominis]